MSDGQIAFMKNGVGGDGSRNRRRGERDYL